MLVALWLLSGVPGQTPCHQVCISSPVHFHWAQTQFHHILHTVLRQSLNQNKNVKQWWFVLLKFIQGFCQFWEQTVHWRLRCLNSIFKDMLLKVFTCLHDYCIPLKFPVIVFVYVNTEQLNCVQKSVVDQEIYQRLLGISVTLKTTGRTANYHTLPPLGGVVASWSARSTLERVLRVWALAGDIVLCSWARHFTLKVPLSTQVYKWVPANLMLRVTLQWTSIPSRGE